MTDSDISGLYKKSRTDRVNMLADMGLLDAETARRLCDGASFLDEAIADKMVENVIGVFGLPFAVAPNFLVNGKAYVVPMVTEEPSVVAGVSSAAKLFKKAGGIAVTVSEPVLTGQIQLLGVRDPEPVIRAVQEAEKTLLREANELQPRLYKRGGGARAIEYFKYKDASGRWIVVLHLLVDTRDAMGANIVNTMCEGIAPHIATLTKATCGLRILSNLCDKSMLRARIKLSLSLLATNRKEAQSIRDGIASANYFANVSPYRAATHNKGIMNGIDAVAIATGNDWRAIEAGAHAFAVRDGQYRSLTNWATDADGNLIGELAIPLKVGIVGGTLLTNPAAVAGLGIVNVQSATELAQVMAATGLAQNFAALRALVTDGIQKGHMRLHARSVAASAKTPPEIFDRVVSGMIESSEIKEWKARQLIAAMQDEKDKSRLSVDSGKEVGTGFAAGKVILLGEHAAVYGKHALALPLKNAIVATIRKSEDGIQFSAPAWHLERQLSPEAASNDPAMAPIALLMRRLGISDSGFGIDVFANIPAGMGLGASAAVVVAITRAFNQLLKLGLNDDAVNDLAFECEKLAHGDPSGVDNTLAVYGQPILFQKNKHADVRELSLAEAPPLVVAASGRRGVTRELVLGVRKLYERNKALYGMILEEMDEIAVAGAAQLISRDYEALGALMNVCHGLLNALQVSTPELEKMVSIARAHGACGAKLTGAGGGGSIVALCPGAVKDVSAALSTAGYQIVRSAESKL